MSMSRIFLTERKKTPIRDDKPGKKTPLAQNARFHESLDLFLVSDSQGNLVLRGNAIEGVPSLFFPLSPSDEKLYFPSILMSLYELGHNKGWGNVQDTPTINADLVTTIIDFFHEYDLEAYQVFCGEAAYKSLWESGELLHPSGREIMQDFPDEDTLDDFLTTFFMHGMMRRRPLYLMPELGPFMMVTAPPSVLGLMTRVGDFVSLVMHNVERSHVILKIG
jgi:hypothetical protein